MFSSNLCLFVFLVLLYFHLILQFSEELRGSGCLRPQRSGFAESGRCLSKLDHSGLNFIMCQDLYSVSPTVKLCVYCDLRFMSIRIGLDLIIVTVISRRWWWFMVFLVIKVIVCLFLLVSYYWFHFISGMQREAYIFIITFLSCSKTILLPWVKLPGSLLKHLTCFLAFH